MSLPASTKVLIVGSGPTGLSAGISLLLQGVKPEDILIVDALQEGDNSSRACIIHAATTEAFDTIGCADELISRGIQVREMGMRTKTSAFISLYPQTQLKGYTKFPFVLALSQAKTEEVLRKKLASLGGATVWGKRAVGLNPTTEGAEVSFETGETVKTKYIVAADGARSAIRTLLHIGFADPAGLQPDANYRQLVLADVSFSSPPPFPLERSCSFGSPTGMLLLIPHADLTPEGDRMYRIAFSLTPGTPAPPSNPPKEYLQKFVNQNGPAELSADPTINPDKKGREIKDVFWTSRFRTHSAVADKFFHELKTDDGKLAAVVILVGDSAHIHSPAGGQGMNLGARDAIYLGPILAAHIKNDDSFEETKSIEEYAASRREKAVQTIKLTKRTMMIGAALTANRYLVLPYLLFKYITKIPFVKKLMMYNLSGLGRP